MKSISLSPCRFLAYTFFNLLIVFLLVNYTYGQPSNENSSKPAPTEEELAEEKKNRCWHIANAIKYSSWHKDDRKLLVSYSKNAKGQLELTFNFDKLLGGYNAARALKGSKVRVNPTDLLIEIDYSAQYTAQQPRPDGLSKNQTFRFNVIMEGDPNDAYRTGLKERGNKAIEPSVPNKLYISPNHNPSENRKSVPYVLTIQDAFEKTERILDYGQANSSEIGEGEVLQLSTPENGFNGNTKFVDVLHIADPSTAKLSIKVSPRECPNDNAFSREMEIPFSEIPKRLDRLADYIDQIREIAARTIWIMQLLEIKCGEDHLFELSDFSYRHHFFSTLDDRPPRPVLPVALSKRVLPRNLTPGNAITEWFSIKSTRRIIDLVDLEKRDPTSSWNQCHKVENVATNPSPVIANNQHIENPELFGIAYARRVLRNLIFSRIPPRNLIGAMEEDVESKLEGHFRWGVGKTREDLDRFITAMEEAQSNNTSHRNQTTSDLLKQTEEWLLEISSAFDSQEMKEFSDERINQDYVGALIIVEWSLAPQYRVMTEVYEAYQEDPETKDMECIKSLEAKIKEYEGIYQKIRKRAIEREFSPIPPEDLAEAYQLTPTQYYYRRSNPLNRAADVAYAEREIVKLNRIIQQTREGKTTLKEQPLIAELEAQKNIRAQAIEERKESRAGIRARTTLRGANANSRENQRTSPNKIGGAPTLEYFEENQSILLYPTITDGQLTVEGLSKDAYIFNTQGQLMYTIAINALLNNGQINTSAENRIAQPTPFTISVSGWSQGLYLLRSGEEMKRFVVR